MQESPDGSPLYFPLTKLDVSESFAKIAAAHGYNTLGEILNIPLTTLVNMDWFSPPMFEELSRMVKQYSVHMK